MFGIICELALLEHATDMSAVHARGERFDLREPPLEEQHAESTRQRAGTVECPELVAAFVSCPDPSRKMIESLADELNCKSCYKCL